MRTSERRLGGASAAVRLTRVLLASLGIGTAAFCAAVSAPAQDGDADNSLDAIRLVPFEAPGSDTGKVDLHGDPLPAGAIARLGTIRYRHGGRVKRVAFLSDNATFVVSNTATGVRLWDAASGRATKEIVLGKAELKDVHVSGDGKRLAVLAWTLDQQTHEPTMRLKVWDAATWNEVAGFEWANGEIAQRVALSPGGTLAATGTRDGWVRLWDLASGEEYLSLKIARGGIASLDFSPEGDWLAVAGFSGAYLWKWSTANQPIALAELPRGGRVARFSPSGTLLAIGAHHGSGAQLYDVPSGELVRKLYGSANYDYADQLEFTGEGRQLVVPSQQKSLEFFDVATGKLVRSLDTRSANLEGVTLSRDGRFAVATGWNDVVTVWDMTSGEAVSDRFAGHVHTIRNIIFFAAGERIASASLDGSLRVWDSKTGEQQYSVHHDRFVTALAASRDGTRLLSSSFDDTVRLWESGQEVYKLPGHGSRGAAGPMAVAFSADEQTLLSFGSDLNLRIFDAATGKKVVEHAIRPSGLTIVESRDGNLRLPDAADPFGALDGDASLALGHASFFAGAKRLYLGMGVQNLTLRCFDVATGQEAEPIALDGKFRDYAMSQSGSRLVLISEPQLPEPPTDPALRRCWLHVRELSGTEILKKELPGSFLALGISPDAALVAVGLYGRSPDRGGQYWISVYSSATGEEVYRIEDFPQPSRSVAFSSDSRRLCASYPDASVLVWDLDAFRIRP